MSTTKNPKNELSDAISTAVEAAKEFATMVNYSRSGTRRMTIYAIAEGLDRTERGLYTALKGMPEKIAAARSACKTQEEVDSIYRDTNRIVSAIEKDWPFGGGVAQLEKLIRYMHRMLCPLGVT